MEDPNNPIHGDVPNIELHLHLEGAIPHEALWELVQKYGGNSDLPDVESLKRRFVYRDFAHFIETWVWKNQFLRQYEDFTFIAEQFGRDLLSQNIVYAEVFFSPADFARHGLTPQGLAQAIRKGLALVPQVEVNLIADMVRDFGPHRAETTLKAVNEVKEYGIIAIGIGGSEQNYPPELFIDVYEQARRMGFHVTAHAGEAAGAQSIWGAIRSLHIERIGHGTRAFEDESLLEFLAEQRIPLEMCPISNVHTGVVKRIEDHPVRRYFERGLLVTINTDDPKMFGNTLSQEFATLEKVFGFTTEEIRTLRLNAIQASWMPDDKKGEFARAL